MSEYRRKIGLAPGTILAPPHDSGVVAVELISYNNEAFIQQESEISSGLKEQILEGQTHWFNVIGTGNGDFLRKLGAEFGLHLLLVEDISNHEQRAKFEDHGEFCIAHLRMLRLGDDGHSILSEKISLLLGNNLLFSFQEVSGDVFNPVRRRIEQKSGRIRSNGGDYLFYALLDVTIDNYFIVVDHFQEEIDRLENELEAGASDELVGRIRRLRKDLIVCRRQMQPLRDALVKMTNSETPLIGERSRQFLTDAYDHLLHVLEITDSQMDYLNVLSDTFYAQQGQRMNEVMKILTIISTTFIPMSFLAGLYGMNFSHIPELNHPNGYYILLGVMGAIFIGMLIFFKRKNWW